MEISDLVRYNLTDSTSLGDSRTRELEAFTKFLQRLTGLTVGKQIVTLAESHFTKVVNLQPNIGGDDDPLKYVPGDTIAIYNNRIREVTTHNTLLQVSLYTGQPLISTGVVADPSKLELTGYKEPSVEFGGAKLGKNHIWIRYNRVRLDAICDLIKAAHPEPIQLKSGSRGDIDNPTTVKEHILKYIFVLFDKLNVTFTSNEAIISAKTPDVDKGKPGSLFYTGTGRLPIVIV